MDEITCSGCGAVYEVSAYKLPVRDPDGEFRCKACGTLVKDWGGSTAYSFRLKTPGTKPPAED